MFRVPVSHKLLHQWSWIRLKSSSSFIRSTFVEYFVQKHGHKHVRSSAVVPLCDPTVPFVNAGMNQFKAVFLGIVDPPCAKAVNSQKCVRVGGKHNDLEMVGTDGHHHTFFEMLGNWSFGDYYKKEACQMAWDLLLGPYRLKPEDLVVTYFSGDAVLNLTEDRECRDIWKQIGVPAGNLIGKGARDNFWEMGATGPCGPCTEINYVNKDGSLTEIWNIVFIQCNREASGKVTALRKQHVDTGMGLERMAALLQRVPTNYDTDLFKPIIRAIEKNSKGVSSYGGRYGEGSELDSAYRKLADHARMISVCLADGVFPSSSLNLKQIMRKSYKLSTDVFDNSQLLHQLYDIVASTIGDAYPELLHKGNEAKLLISHEQEAYAKLRSSLNKKWKDLMKQYPEVEVMSDVENAGFVLGYKELKEAMSKLNSTLLPGELVFKLYDTHGFQEEVIERVAKLNNFEIDKPGFWKLLKEHKSRHKTAFKEQSSNKGMLFHKAIEDLIKIDVKSTNDHPKYDYSINNNEIIFEPLKTNLLLILNEDLEWIDMLEPIEYKPYYLVTKHTNFYCEEGGQSADSGFIIINESVTLNVESVFKIRGYVFHKGYFSIDDVPREIKYVRRACEVVLEINKEKRLNIMRNHTAVHLLNVAIRKVLPNSVVYQIGSNVSDKGLSLNLSVYGEKLSQRVIMDAQDLVRQSISSASTVDTRVIDSVEMSSLRDVLTVPGETYPESGLRLVSTTAPLQSKELCCGTHVPSTGFIEDFCVTLVKGAGSNTPTIHALTGHRAKEARELFCRTEKLQQVIDLVDPHRKKEEVSSIKSQLSALCGTSGAPHGEYQQCLALLDDMLKRPPNDEVALKTIAEQEILEAVAVARAQGRRFVVHFLRCSYLMQGSTLALTGATTAPALVLGCAGGLIIGTCTVPQEYVTCEFDAARWLGCVTGVFQSAVLPPQRDASPLTYAEMTATKVSLITCEQLVQDAMRVAIKFAQSHIKDVGLDDGESPTQDRRKN